MRTLGLERAVFFLAFLAMAAGPAPAEEGRIKATFRRGSGRIAKEGNQVVMEGDVVIRHEDVQIESDRAVYDEKAGLLTADGRVRLFHRETRVEAESLAYHTETKEGLFQGRVKVIRAEAPAKQGGKDGFTLACGRLEFSLPRQEMTASNSVRLAHRDFAATAETLTYSDERQEMLLRGRPTLSRRKEKVAAEEILLSMEEDTFTFLGATASIAGDGEEPVTISFARGEGRLKARDKVNMTGEVKARHGTTSIAAPQAAYDDGAGTIAFAGGVDLRSREAAVTASELLYRRDRKSGTCRGEVHLVRPEEKDENGKAIKDGLILDCSELDFVTDDKTFVARGGVRLHHRDLDAVAEEMRYDDDHQELVLTGSPVLSRKDEEIRAVEVRLAVEKDAFFLREATITSAGKDPVSVSFREGRGNIKEEGRGEVAMEGDVTARQGKTVMRAERAGYEKRSGTMAFRGRVELVREDLTVKAEELDYRRDEQEGTFRRDVFLVRREEKNAAGETTGDGFSLRCAELTFAAEPEHFIARGGARLEHERFMAEAEEMRYRGDDRVLTLAGRPRLIHGDEMVEADTIVIAMREETIRLTQATVSFKVGSADGAKDAGHKPPAP